MKKCLGAFARAPGPESGFKLDHNPYGSGGLSLDLNPVCLHVNAINLDRNPRVKGAFEFTWCKCGCNFLSSAYAASMISGVSGYIGTEASLSPTDNSRQGGIMQTSQLTLFGSVTHYFGHFLTCTLTPTRLLTLLRAKITNVSIVSI